MKLRKVILIVLICLLCIPISIKAEELNDYQKALKEVADSYLRKVPYVRYSNSKDMRNITPEMASEQNNIYTECAAFVGEIYREALNININHSTYLIAGCAYVQRNDHPDVMRKIWGPANEGFENQPSDISFEAILNEIEVGDIIVSVETNSKAHTQMVYEIDGDNTNLIEANEWPADASLSNKVNLFYTSTGGVRTWKLKTAINHFKNDCKYIFIIRPLGDSNKETIDFKNVERTGSYTNLSNYTCESVNKNVVIPDRTICRVNYPKMDITKTVSSSNKTVIDKNEVEVGDLLTYKIVIKNNSNSNYNGINVEENIPNNVTYQSSTGGASVSDGKVVWNNVVVAANSSKTLTYTVKINSDAFRKTIESVGKVCSIDTAKITNIVGKTLTSKEKNDIISAFNSSTKTNSIELINDIYSNALGIDNLISNDFNITDLVMEYKHTTNNHASNPKAISLNEESNYYNMIFNNYYAGVVSNSTGYKMHYWEKNPFMWPTASLPVEDDYRSDMADTIYSEHFETGDILIILENGVQEEYIYLENSNPKFYNKTGSFPEDNESVSFNKLFEKDRYVILRPSLTFKKQLEKPTLDKTKYTYTSEEVVVNISNYDSNTMNISGIDRATNAGNYSVKISLKDKDNYEWTDSTTKDITLNWNIEKANQDAPVVTAYEGIYDGKSHTIEVTGENLEYSIDGVVWLEEKPTRTEIGKTTVYVRVKEDENHNASEIVEGTITIIDGTDYEIISYDVDENYISNIKINTDIEKFKDHIILGEGYTVEIDTKNINNKEVLYTGGKTRILKNGTLYKQYTNIVKGDTNGTGQINSGDLLRVRQHLLGTKILKDEYFIASDVNGDGVINSGDLLRVRQHLLGTRYID